MTKSQLIEEFEALVNKTKAYNETRRPHTEDHLWSSRLHDAFRALFIKMTKKQNEKLQHHEFPNWMVEKLRKHEDEHPLLKKQATEFGLEHVPAEELLRNGPNGEFVKFPWFDHWGTIGEDQYGHKNVFVSEPYEASGDDLRKILSFCELYNLDVHVSGKAEHNENCLRIAFRPKKN